MLDTVHLFRKVFIMAHSYCPCFEAVYYSVLDSWMVMRLEMERVVSVSGFWVYDGQMFVCCYLFENCLRIKTVVLPPNYSWLFAHWLALPKNNPFGIDAHTFVLGLETILNYTYMILAEIRV